MADSLLKPLAEPLAEPLADAALFDLMSWMSPAWPIGSFAFSGGLEWAVEQGMVRDRASTTDWFGTLLDHGPIHNDAVIFVHAWRAVRGGVAAQLCEVAELAAAAQTGFERRLEATAQGAAFRRIALDSLDPPRSRGGRSAPPSTEGALLTPQPSCPGAAIATDFATFLAEIPDADLTYPVAAATLFACHGISLGASLTAFLHGVIANLVSAAQRLVPLGQTDAQRVMRDLRVMILAAVDTACALPNGDAFDAFTGSALMAELGCMAHETQYTRLFRT